MGKNITSALKGHDFRSNITPDDEQVIFLKDDIEKIASNDSRDISRLLAIQLKTKNILKQISFPERIVTVLFSPARKQ